MRLSEYTGDRKNTVSLIKFIAAIAVIYSHSYPLTGLFDGDFMGRYTGGQTTYGGMAVAIFFFYSGFFIMKSMESKKTAGAFFKARVLRLFPQLWLVVLASVFVMGPLMTVIPLQEYFRSSETYRYLLNGVLLPQYYLPGVFWGNIYQPSINGSLWTLQYEFVCYVFCFVFYKLHLHERRFAKYALAVGVIGYFVVWYLRPEYYAMMYCMIFFMGMMFYIYRDLIPMHWLAAVAMIILWIVGTKFRLYYAVAIIAYPYVLSFLGFCLKPKHVELEKWSLLKASYGIYLVAFPIQQIFVFKMPGISQMKNFILATLVSIAVGTLLSLWDKWLSAKFQ